MVGVSGGVMAGWLESSAVLDCKGGQLVLLTRDQYCPPSGWSQAAGSDRGPCGVIGSGGPASRLPTPTPPFSTVTAVTCHPPPLLSPQEANGSLLSPVPMQMSAKQMNAANIRHILHAFMQKQNLYHLRISWK